MGEIVHWFFVLFFVLFRKRKKNDMALFIWEKIMVGRIGCTWIIDFKEFFIS